MTAPIWMASPPEVHSALLTSGAGAGPLLAAAESWRSLSTVYAQTAEELAALLSTAQAGSWEGPTAEAYLGAHAPYLAWLTQSSADSAAMAAQLETAAAAYVTALAAMPTLPELAANHAVHAALAATNFLGINTIPIALNEADYVRMWIQAATVMGTYQGVTGTAVAAAPPAAPAPQIVKSEAAPAASRSNFTVPTIWDFFTAVDHLIEQSLPPSLQQTIGSVFWVLESPANLMSQLQYNFPMTNIPSITWASAYQELFVLDPYYYNSYWPTVIAAAGNNPEMLLWVSFIYSAQIGIDFSWEFSHVTYLMAANGLLTPLAYPLAIVPTGAVGGFAGLAGLAGIAPAPVVPLAPPAPPVPFLGVPPIPVPTAVPITVTAVTPAPASVPAPVPAPASPPVPAPPHVPPLVDAGPYSYLVGNLGLASQTGESAGARRKAPMPDVVAPAALAAAAVEESQRRRRGRSRAQRLGRGYEYMDLNWAMEPSERGAGALGFAGTADKGGAGQPAGLITLADDAFAGSPRTPMRPSTWGSDSAATSDLPGGGDNS